MALAIRSVRSPVGLRWIGSDLLSRSIESDPSFVLSKTMNLLVMRMDILLVELNRTAALVTKLSRNPLLMNFPDPEYRSERCR